MIEYDSDAEELERMMVVVGTSSNPEEEDNRAKSPSQCNGAVGVPLPNLRDRSSRRGCLDLRKWAEVRKWEVGFFSFEK